MFYPIYVILFTTSVMRRKTSAVEREIRSHSRKLQSPTDYWKGKPETNPRLPENILLFSRRQTSELGLTASQHHRFILIANLATAGSVAIDAQVFPLYPGQGLLVFPFQTHFYAHLASRSLNWIFVTFELARNPAFEKLKNHGAQNLTPQSRSSLCGLLEAWQDPAQQQTLPLHLGLLLHGLARSVETHSPLGPARATPPANDTGLVQRVNSLVFQNRHQPLSIENMASSLGHSASFLRKRFQGATGRSIGRHAREIRLNYACELLHDSSLRIEEIAHRCGYETLFTFSRAFKHAFGCTPSQYRQRR